MLKNLHRLRGVAALTVVISHLTHWHEVSVPGPFDKMLNSSGLYAVGVFFVISGFIIARSHHEEMGSISFFKSYCIKRFFRIYPAYWAYSALFIALGALGFQCWDHSNLIARNSAQFISAIFLFPATGAPNGFLAVSWSLYYEILFYCVFACFFINRRLGFSVLAVFVISGLTRHAYPITSLYCINRINILFLTGVMMGLFFDRVDLTYTPPIVLTVAGGLCYAWAILRTVPMNSAFVYASAALLVAGAVAADLRDKNLNKEPAGSFGKLLMWLGTISYSLYLCHVPVQAILYRLFGQPYQSAAIATIFVIAPVLAASGGYLLIEKPSQNLV